MTPTTTNARPLSLLAALVLLTACADVPHGEPAVEPTPGDVYATEGEDDGVVLYDTDFIGKSSCHAGYEPSASAAAASSQVSLGYTGAGQQCEGGQTPGVNALCEYLRSQFPNSVNTAAAGSDRGCGGYACRHNTANPSELSVHATGRALDLHIHMAGGDADNGLGDPVANWLVENAQSIGVQLVIWDHTIWNPNRAEEFRCYGGPNPHTDHLHIELTPEAGRKATPFFNGGAATQPDASQGADQAGQGADEAGQGADEAGQGADQAGQGADQAGQSGQEDQSGQGCDDWDFDGVCDDQQAQGGQGGQSGQGGQGCDDWNFDGICDDQQAQGGQDGQGGQSGQGCDDWNFDGICDDQQAQDGQGGQGCDDWNFDGICDDQQAQGGQDGQGGQGCDDWNFDGICDDQQAQGGQGSECFEDADCGEGGYCDTGYCY